MDIALAIDWAKLGILTESIASDIRASQWVPDYLVGISRGGLVPAVLLSHKLGIKMYTLDVSLRDLADELSEYNLWMPEDAANGKNILIVDDINDSGETIKWIRNDWHSSIVGLEPPDDIWWHDRIKIAVVANNLGSNEKVDYRGMDIDKRVDPRWVVFPWEPTDA